jgi:hypothetical protein
VGRVRVGSRRGAERAVAGAGAGAEVRTQPLDDAQVGEADGVCSSAERGETEREPSG